VTRAVDVFLWMVPYLLASELRRGLQRDCTAASRSVRLYHAAVTAPYVGQMYRL